MCMCEVQIENGWKLGRSEWLRQVEIRGGTEQGVVIIWGDMDGCSGFDVSEARQM